MKIWPLRTMAIGCRETARNLSNFMGYNDVFEANITSADVFLKAGVKRELLDTVKARKLAYCGLTTRKQGSCLEKEIVQGTMPDAHRQGRPHTAWMGNIKT